MRCGIRGCEKVTYTKKDLEEYRDKMREASKQPNIIESDAEESLVFNGHLITCSLNAGLADYYQIDFPWGKGKKYDRTIQLDETLSESGVDVPFMFHIHLDKDNRVASVEIIGSGKDRREK
jgi:hypothetical protein